MRRGAPSTPLLRLHLPSALSASYATATIPLQRPPGSLMGPVVPPQRPATVVVRVVARPARTLDFTFMVFSCGDLVPCPSHVDPASPILAALAQRINTDRLSSRTIGNLNGIRRNNYAQAEQLLQLGH